MIVPLTLLIFSLQILITKSACPQATPVSYSIEFENPSYVTTLKRQDVIVSSVGNALSLQIEDNVTNLCAFMMKIYQPVYLFACHEKQLEYIEPGTFSNQQITANLDVSGNLLTVIRSGTFRNMPVRVISLNANKITTIEPFAFSDLPNLSYLGLSENYIKDLDSSAINVPTFGLYINLRYNKMERLPQRQFSIIGDLGSVNLDFNELVDIDPDAFGGANIYEVTLTYNYLTFLPEVFFIQSNITRLYLKGNRFDCHTIDTIRRFKKENKPNIISFDETADCPQ